MLANKLNKWYSSAKRFLFRYKDGFFELPVLSNSPETIVKSISMMPFVKHSSQEKWFGTNNPFMKGSVYYHMAEEGLWYMHSNATYKENVNFKRFKNKDLASDYYLLFLEINRTEEETKRGMLDGLSYSDSSWVLLKPKVGNTHSRFKGSNTLSLCLFMSESWVKKNLYRSEGFIDSPLGQFINSKAKMIMWEEDIDVAERIEKSSQKMFVLDQQKPPKSVQEKDDYVVNFIDHFIGRSNQEKGTNNLFELEQTNRDVVLQARQYLLKNLNGKFMGIEELAAIVGASETNLKKNFKLIYEDSIFQYFRKRQLEKSKYLLQSSDMSIKEIASIFGYSNSSKFTQAYKNYFEELPSETRGAHES